MAVRPQSYNPTHATLESVQAVVDDGNQVIVLSPSTATILRAGAVTGTVSGHTFPTAAAIPAADGNGQWLVGVESGGQLYRLRAGRDFEEVSARYGFGQGAGNTVRAACALSGRSAGFLLADGALAVADGQNVSRYRLGGPTAQSGGEARLSCGSGRAAVVLPGEVRTFDSTTRNLRSFALPAVGAAFDSRGRLIVATANALYVEEPIAAGELKLRYLARDRDLPLHSLAGTASRIWFAAGEELGAVETSEGSGEVAIAVTRGAQLSAKSQLLGSATGDVWVLAEGQLRRFGRDDGALQPKERWMQLIAPVFARSCTACHLPGGRAGIDLSTAAAWDAKRSLIRERVIEKHNMPPSGSPLLPADRATIQSWLDSEP
jgi:hypothetical protein